MTPGAPTVILRRALLSLWCAACYSCLPSTTAGGMSAAMTAAAGGMLLMRLVAEKRVFSKHPVVAISPAEAAARLVCLSAEGQVGASQDQRQMQLTQPSFQLHFALQSPCTP